MKKVSSDKAFDAFKPENCVFVISVDNNGRPNGMIAGWSMKCSAKPALLAVALSKEGHTHKLIKQSKEFVVAVPNKKLEKDLLFFGSTHGQETDKFAKTRIKTTKARFLKSPLLKDATINFECRLFKEVNSGDHLIFIGKVLASYLNENKKVLLNMGKAGNKIIFKEF